jgi:enoyl-CoA hydratase/carnithine racemase
VRRIRCETLGAIQILTIDNETKRNAFSGSMAKELVGHLDQADQTPGVRCIIITGVGDKAFSSGHDLSEILDQGEASLSPENNRVFTRPASMVKPTIAAVNGAAYAAGLILALSCDLRVASKNASFCVSGARVGLLPIGGQLSRLPRLMPYARALEMVMTAEPMSAEDAYAIGFINRLVSQGNVLSASLELAERIAANSPLVVQEAKKGVEISLRLGLAAGEAFEWDSGPSLATTPDAEEGVQAFLEKRAPKFKDR